MNRRSQYGNRNSKYSNRSTGITYTQAVRKREMLIEEISSLVAQKLARDGQYYLNESNQELLEEGISDLLKSLTLSAVLALTGTSVSAQNIQNPKTPKEALSKQVAARQEVLDTVNVMPDPATGKELAMRTKRKLGTAEPMFAILAIHNLDPFSKNTSKALADEQKYIQLISGPEYAHIGTDTLEGDYTVKYDLAEPAYIELEMTTQQGKPVWKPVTPDMEGYSEIMEYIRENEAFKIADLLDRGFKNMYKATGRTAKMIMPPSSYPEEVRMYVDGARNPQNVKTFGGETFRNVKIDGKVRLPYTPDQFKSTLMKAFAKSMGIDTRNTTQMMIGFGSSSWDIMGTIDKIVADATPNLLAPGYGKRPSDSDLWPTK